MSCLIAIDGKTYEKVITTSGPGGSCVGCIGKSNQYLCERLHAYCEGLDTIFIDRKNMKVSEWIMVDHCAMRILEGGSVDNLYDRVAVIEKTPRVRTNFSTEHGDYLNWATGLKGNDEYGLNVASRRWCDYWLVKLGYIL